MHAKPKRGPRPEKGTKYLPICESLQFSTFTPEKGESIKGKNARSKISGKSHPNQGVVSRKRNSAKAVASNELIHKYQRRLPCPVH